MKIQPQQGVVLVVALWVIAMLTVLLAAFTLTVKTSRQTTVDVMLGVQARTATDAVLNYLAALNAVAAPELNDMPGQRYELQLDGQEVSFRLIPESAFVPVNRLDFESLTALLSYWEVAGAEDKALHLIELRSERLDEASGEVLEPVQIQSMEQLTRLLDLDLEALRAEGRWLSYVGSHSRVVPGYVPDELYAVLEQFYEPLEQDGAMDMAWQSSTAYRVQVEVSAPLRPRRVEAVASFSGAQYRLLLINEYNVDFSLNDLSE